MSRLLRTIVTLGAALMLTMSPALAKDLGIYQTADRKMDFKLTTCGGGDDLCVKLLAARGSAKTPQTKRFIGKLVVNKARANGENNWSGNFHFGKYDLNAGMTLRPGKNFVISGCVYLVICDDFTLIPAR